MMGPTDDRLMGTAQQSDATAIAEHHLRTTPPPRKPDPIIFSIRGTKQWRAWLSQFAAQQRVNPTALIDQTLAEAARRAGFASPPPRYRGLEGGEEANPNA